MKRFFTATVLILGTVAFSFAQKDTGAVLKFDDSKQNFGFVRDGEVVQMPYKFTNTGTKPVIIKEVKVSCGCTVVDFPKTPILPGQKGVIKISFDTHGKYDRQDRTVDVISNANGSPQQLRFKGVVLKPK
ncbi:MAG TPA: DUF1573 domain-containing protein [Bacteroidia bacterium]|jgi:hypothetical protein